MERDISVADLAEKAGLPEKKIEALEQLTPEDIDNDGPLSLNDWELLQVLGKVLTALDTTLEQFTVYIAEHHSPDLTINELEARAKTFFDKAQSHLGKS